MDSIPFGHDQVQTQFYQSLKVSIYVLYGFAGQVRLVCQSDDKSPLLYALISRLLRLCKFIHEHINANEQSMLGKAIKKFHRELHECAGRCIVSVGDLFFTISATIIDIYVIIRLMEMRLRPDIFSSYTPQIGIDMTNQLMALYRLEAKRQTTVCMEIIETTLKTEGLFSEDPSYPGLTRQSLNSLKRTLGTEIAKLEANEATIAVMGTVKSGKSTTISAIVGSEVVPSRDQPMTTFPTRIIHKRGVLEPVLTFPLARSFEKLSLEIEQELAHLKREAPHALTALLSQAPQKSELEKLIVTAQPGTITDCPRSVLRIAS